MFSESYIEARDRFLHAAMGSADRLLRLPVLEEDGEWLTIDIAVYGNGPRAAVLISGTHGVEGYAGSAVQLDFLKSGLPSDLRVILIHAVNPYGMHHFRRVNENNVDLNRNCLGPDEDYSGASNGYQKLDPLLNPQKAFRSNRDFVPKALWFILRHGFSAAKQAATGGQYAFPEGIFYGGAGLERGPRLLKRALPRLFEGCTHIGVLDFHVGLGERGRANILVRPDKGTPDFALLEGAFASTVAPWVADAGVGYDIRGALGDLVENTLGERDFFQFMTPEFGSLAGLPTMAALRAENQAHHHGGDIPKAKALIRKAFYPDETLWQEMVLDEGRVLVKELCALLRMDHSSR